MDSEGIYSRGYGRIPKMIMQDRSLHIAAKAIYAYLASFAGASSCCYPSRGKICSDLGISSDTFSKYLKQLTDSGYLFVAQEKEHGRFSHNVYTLPDMVLPCPIDSATETSVHGGMVSKSNSSKNNKNKKKNSNTKASASGFEDFWKAYPKKKAREAAKKAWDKLRPGEELRNVILQAVQIQINTPDWKKANGQYIPYPETWLNNRRWEDDVAEQKQPEAWMPGKNPYAKYL
jgi:DNA replication protein DnaC